MKYVRNTLGIKNVTFASPPLPPSTSCEKPNKYIINYMGKYREVVMKYMCVLHLTVCAAFCTGTDCCCVRGVLCTAKEPEYGRAACEAACDVVRSCALSPECRSLLAQSGFFVDAVAQIR